MSVASADISLRRAVLARLIAHPLVRTGHIGVAASAGGITLCGYVTSNAQKDAAITVARRVEGVQRVTDDLRVAAPCPNQSLFDHDLIPPPHDQESIDMTDALHGAHDAAAPNPNAAVTGVHRRTLDAVFAHPLAHNLSWREVVNLFSAIGGAEEKHNGEFVFRAGDESLVMKKPHNKDMTGPEVMELRHLLTRTGWSPTASAAPNGDTAAPEHRLIVVIDHAGAKVYQMDRSDDSSHGATAEETRHLLHHLERKMRDEDRKEAYPDDMLFFEQVAEALSTGGEIVVIGHGKGQSNEADHLSAYLKSHQALTYARIVRQVVADLPHLTTPELLELGRRAFTQA
jgi:hypothetical protein